VSTYVRRIIDQTLDELQPQLRATALEGPKAVGKTATAARRAATVLSLDLASQRALLEADPEILMKLPGPILVDEWQRLPASWDYIRRAVDAGAPPGHFILAGSALPRRAAIHSGAGRIVPLRMRPLSLAERGLDKPSVSLADLLTGKAEVSGRTTVRLADYVQEIIASGLPGLRGSGPRALRAELDAYIENAVSREFVQQGYAVRKPDTLRAWLTAYAAATATTTSYTSILDAATPNLPDKPAKETVGSYREALASLWLLDPLPAWTPTHNHLKRLGMAAKHNLADPALAARLLGFDLANLLTGDARTTKGDPILGALFESLITLSVRTYAERAEARVYHLRTNGGAHEVDLIVQRPDGRVVAIEVKLRAGPRSDDARHLAWLKRTIGDDLLASVIVTTGQQAYTQPDGVVVVPAALLGP